MTIRSQWLEAQLADWFVREAGCDIEKRTGNAYVPITVHLNVGFIALEEAYEIDLKALAEFLDEKLPK